MHKRVSINQICFLQRTSYLTEYKHGKLCWIAVGSFYQDIDNIMCTMKKGKKTALWHRKVAKTCKATILLAWFKLFPRADCEGMWQVPIFAIISTYATCQSEH